MMKEWIVEYLLFESIFRAEQQQSPRPSSKLPTWQQHLRHHRRRPLHRPRSEEVPILPVHNLLRDSPLKQSWK